MPRARPSSAWQRTSSPTASARCPSSSATWTGPRRARRTATRPELPQNCAAVLHHGAVVARYAKHHLPTYGVFDEARVFAPGHDLAVVRVRGVDVALAICEDIWQEGGPVSMAREAGAELLLVLNGSPYEREKDDTRLELAARRAGQAACALAYLNLVGGQDELVFDGDSIVVDADGTVLARGPQFVEDLVVLDLDLAESTFDPADVTEESRSPRSPWRPHRRMPRGRLRRHRASAPWARSTGPWSSGCATTSARTACPLSSLASPAASTPRWWRPSPATPWVPPTSTASRCRASTPRTTPRTTPPTSRSAPA